MVFQDYALFPHLNVRDNAAFGPRMQHWPSGRIERRVKELLELVRLPGYGGRRVSGLSGGEQQRVALARALAPDPELLLLDEPLSALDAKLRSELRGEIRRIQKQLGVTTVYVTHDQEEALAISDRIALMNAGHIEQTGTPREVYSSPSTLFAAGFMGIDNRVEGTVDSVEEGCVFVQTPEGLFEGRTRGSITRGVFNDGSMSRGTFNGSALTRDDRAVALFRAEHCRVETSSGKSLAPAPNSISGRVTGSEYQGERTVVTVQAVSGRFSARCDAQTTSCAPGDRVVLRVDPENVLVIPHRA
jgi:ABC-type Fe3+/spermidine/putrescine transport system ATPase subunit